jgi:site-specific DNA recombinase
MRSKTQESAGYELWQQVKVRQARVPITMGKDERGNALNRAQRRKYLLSGLLQCTCCGEPFAVLVKDRFGCRNYRSKGTCTNSRTIKRQRIEGRVIGALRHKMLTPELTAQFVRTFEGEIARHQRETVSTEARLQPRLSDVERKLSGILRAIEDGNWNDSLKQRLNELEAEKRGLQEQ